jgi:hypothetical protein
MNIRSRGLNLRLRKLVNYHVSLLPDVLAALRQLVDQLDIITGEEILFGNCADCLLERKL